MLEIRLDIENSQPRNLVLEADNLSLCPVSGRGFRQTRMENKWRIVLASMFSST